MKIASALRNRCICLRQRNFREYQFFRVEILFKLLVIHMWMYKNTVFILSGCNQNIKIVKLWFDKYCKVDWKNCSFLQLQNRKTSVEYNARCAQTRDKVRISFPATLKKSLCPFPVCRLAYLHVAALTTVTLELLKFYLINSIALYIYETFSEHFSNFDVKPWTIPEFPSRINDVNNNCNST